MNPVKAFFTKYGLVIVLVSLIATVGLTAWKFYGIGYADRESEYQAEKNEKLEAALEESKRYQSLLQAEQAKNRKFTLDQRKAKADAKEENAPCAPVLCNTIKRLYGIPE